MQNKPVRTGFGLGPEKSHASCTSPEKSHASCRVKVKQPSPDEAKVKAYTLTFSARARPRLSEKTYYYCSQKQRREPQTIPRRPKPNLEDDRPCGQNRDLKLGSRSSASAGSGSRSRASSESRSRETSEHAAAPPYPSPASLSRSI